jgi:Holliday junction DNA helicase RuvA
MIGSLRGTVLERNAPTHVLVEVAGVGYIVAVTPRVFGELEPTTGCFLYIHHQVREDAQTLFGFLTREERDSFQILIAAHGVGPAMAMAILAIIPLRAYRTSLLPPTLQRSQWCPESARKLPNVC